MTTVPQDVLPRLQADSVDTRLDALYELIGTAEHEAAFALDEPTRDELWRMLLAGADADDADEDGVPFVLGDAACALAAAQMLRRALGTAGLFDGLRERLAADRTEATRRQAAWALGRFGDGSVTGAVYAALDDADPSVRATVAAAACRLGRTSRPEPERLARLLAMLADDGQPLPVRRAVALHVREVPGPETTGALLSVLGDKHGDEELQAGALRALSYAPSAAVVKPLCRIVNTWRREPAVKVEAARTLGYTRDERALEVLVEHLRDGNPAVRAACAEALGHFEEPAAIEPLAELLHSEYESPSIRRLAALSIGNVAVAPHVADDATQKGVAALLDMLAEFEEAGEYEPEVTVSILDALGQFRGEAVADVLRDFLDAPDSDVRDAALRAYARQDAADRLERLHEAALSGQDEDLRIVAAEALARLADPESEDVLLNVLAEPDEYLQARAVYGLGRMRSARAVRTLMQWAGEPPTSGLRPMALEALGRIGEVSALSVVEREFTRPGAWPRVKVKAAGALARLGRAEKARPWLRDQAGRREPEALETALAAAVELSDLGDAAGIDTLLAHTDARWGDDVRLTVVRGLRRLVEETADKQAREALEALATGPDLLIRQAARGLWP